MNEKSVVTRGGWAAGFTVASVWFGTHIGAGFATGNQVINYFVQYGWTAAIWPLVSMGILAYVMFVIMKFARLRGFDNYKDTFRELYAPYHWMEIIFEVFYMIIILAAVAAAISGAANLLVKYFYLNIYLSTLIVTVILILLSIFGVKLIIAASTVLSTGILITAGIMIIVGISTHTSQVGEAFSAGLTNPGTAFWRGGLIYCGFQCVSVPAMIAAATTLNQKGVKKASILGWLMNGGLLALSGIMLLGWYSEIQAAGTAAIGLPNSFVCDTIGWTWLIAFYNILLFCAFISTCVTLIYTTIVRFEGKFFPGQLKNDKARKTVVGVIVIAICMSLSLLGITWIITYAYGYDGYLGLAAVVLPVIIIGNIKNKKFIAANPKAMES